ncbi:hypothetical protein OVV86_26650, partial [Klebsiella pneumoniae]|uniref:hypothetical protein n=1 Tax=Klebsiella pneumoniae TaxID=573 RepID=UPI00226FCFA8
GACVACTVAVDVAAAQTRPASSSPGAERTVWPDEGPRTWAPRPTAPEITANDLRKLLYQLSDDSMRWRRIGEPGNFVGTAYVAREFQRLGL